MLSESTDRPLTKWVAKHGKAAHINPVLQSYLSLSQDLAVLKKDLRTDDNIEAIIRLSRKQVALKAQLKELLASEHRQRSLQLWNQVVLALGLALITWGFLSLFWGRL